MQPPNALFLRYTSIRFGANAPPPPRTTEHHLGAGEEVSKTAAAFRTAGLASGAAFLPMPGTGGERLGDPDTHDLQYMKVFRDLVGYGAAAWDEATQLYNHPAQLHKNFALGDYDTAAWFNLITHYMLNHNVAAAIATFVLYCEAAMVPLATLIERLAVADRKLPAGSY